MARAGLSPQWNSVWANDFSEEKASVYRKNWGEKELQVRDIAGVLPSELPEAEMAWASFPCQDLSLAGTQIGIGSAGDSHRTRSGMFWCFLNLAVANQPPILVLENVTGALTSNGGRDISSICSALRESGYFFGPLVADAIHWVPQSRQRLFIVAVHESQIIPAYLTQGGPSELWHPDSVCRAYASVGEAARERWIWWNLPLPAVVRPKLEAIVDAEPSRWVRWDDAGQRDYLLSLMNERHRDKVRKAQLLGNRIVGLGYRRTRENQQRLEVRFDGVAGCLRTAAGGSSRQIVVEVCGKLIRTRLISPREAARLQGLPDDYWLPESYNEAYDLVGDGLCVPVVRHLGEYLLSPIAAALNAPVGLTA